MTKREPEVSLDYLRLSFGHCVDSVLLTDIVWSLYCLCTTYGFRLAIVLSLYYLPFRLVIVLSLFDQRKAISNPETMQ
jgi:hypothetical protein